MTLIELIVTIGVVSLVTTALMSLIQSFYQNNTFLIEQTTALSSTRRGMNETVSAIREASYGDDGSYPIAAAATSSMTIFADVDQDTAIERIQFMLLNGTLYRIVTNATGTPLSYASGARATTTIAQDVRNTALTPVFSYFNAAGTQLSTSSPSLSSIVSVRIQLLVDLNPNRLPNVFTLSQSVTLRNLQKN